MDAPTSTCCEHASSLLLEKNASKVSQTQPLTPREQAKSICYLADRRPTSAQNNTQQKDTVDPFWVTAARELFSNGAGVLRQKGVTRNKVLVDHLLKTDLTALAEAMEGTVAESIVNPDNPKTALSVRAMLTANLSALEFLPDEGKPFSIHVWIADEDRGGFLFLTSRGDGSGARLRAASLPP